MSTEQDAAAAAQSAADAATSATQALAAKQAAEAARDALASGAANGAGTLQLTDLIGIGRGGMLLKSTLEALSAFINADGAVLGQDLANPSDPAKGAAMIGYAGTTVSAALTAQEALIEAVLEGLAERVQITELAGSLANQGAELVGYKYPFAKAKPRKQSEYNRQVLYAADWGWKSSNTAVENLQAFKDVIDDAPARAKIVFADDGGGVFNIATTSLSNAVNVNKRLVLQIDCDIKASFSAIQADPPHIMRLTADRIIVTGTGSLIGDGTVNDLNTGDISTFPGLIRIEANKCKITIDTIDTPPKCGITMVSAFDTTISVRNWQGGVVNYTVGNTGYFGVYNSGGGRNRYLGNGFNRDAAGGRLINAIFNLNSDDNQVLFNFADVHEKLIYNYGSRNQIAYNKGKDAIRTDFIRLMKGDYNVVRHNQGDNLKGMCSCYDGIRNEIEDNTGTRIQQTGTFVGRNDPTYVGGFSGTKVRRNKYYADPAAVGVTLAPQGIRFYAEGAESTDIDVSDNECYGFGISVEAASPQAVRKFQVKHNFIGDSANGFFFDRCTHAVIEGNRARNLTGYMFTETGSAFNRYLNNEGQDITSIGINGLATTSYGEGNRYNDQPLSGVVTLAVAVTTTITHGGIAANAQITLAPINDAAGLMPATKGYPRANRSGANILITVTNGSNAVGTEQFYWQVRQ